MIPENIPRVSRFRAKSSDSRKNFVFLPKQAFLELTSSVQLSTKLLHPLEILTKDQKHQMHQAKQPIHFLTHLRVNCNLEINLLFAGMNSNNVKRMTASLAYTNIVPQFSDLNQEAWRLAEIAIRDQFVGKKMRPQEYLPTYWHRAVRNVSRL